MELLELKKIELSNQYIPIERGRYLDCKPRCLNHKCIHPLVAMKLFPCIRFQCRHQHFAIVGVKHEA